MMTYREAWLYAHKLWSNAKKDIRTGKFVVNVDDDNDFPSPTFRIFEGRFISKHPDCLCNTINRMRDIEMISDSVEEKMKERIEEMMTLIRDLGDGRLHLVYYLFPLDEEGARKRAELCLQFANEDEKNT